MSSSQRAPLVLDSVTHLTDADKGGAGYCASHGGRYAAYYAAYKGMSGVILNDAGIGRERAGIAGLAFLDDLGVPAAAISSRSARIGDGADGMARGVLSAINAAATRSGLQVGMSCTEAARLLAAAGLPPAPTPPAEQEFRFEIAAAGREGVNVIGMDSISLVKPEDAGHIVVAASHGAILGGRPETAVKYDAFAVITNDADRGMDDAGVSRLPAMDTRDIAGACCSAFSCRIGDGRSLYEDGYISTINDTAARHGGMVGMSCKEFVAAMVAARIKGRAS